MKTKTFQKIGAVLLAAVMTICLFPATAFAHIGHANHMPIVLGTIIPQPSNSKITSFTIPDQAEDTYIYESIDGENNDIYILMPYGTDLSDLTPTIVHEGVSINPMSGVPQDFTDPVEYTVTDGSGLNRVYMVNVISREVPELVVKSVTPAGTEVPISTDILAVTFNQEMMDSDDGSVTINGGATLSNPRWNNDLTTITYDLAGLSYNTEYEVTIDEFTSRIEEPMTEPYFHTFTTEAQSIIVTYYTVTYDANGGSGTAPRETDKTADELFTTAYNTFTAPNGWQFHEWNTKADGTGFGYGEGGEIFMPANNLTLYAIWAQIPASSIKVTFDPQGGTVTPTSKTVVYNEAYGSLPVPTRDGYTFWGWHTTKTGGMKVTAEIIVSADSDHTLYAQWTVSTDIPKTGDNSSMLTYVILTLLAAATFVFMAIKRKIDTK